MVNSNYWLRGKPSDLPCFRGHLDASSHAWIDGKLLKMNAPLLKNGGWHPIDGSIYKLYVTSTGALVDAYYIQANSVMPINGNWIIRHFDIHDARAIRLAESGGAFEFEVEWDDSRQRELDGCLAAEIESAPLRYEVP